MSEIPKSPESFDEEDARYQAAALKLFATCLEHLNRIEPEAETSGDVYGGYYLDPPSSYDLPEWDSIEVDIFPRDSKDEAGDDKFLKIEFVQDINPDLMLIERFVLTHDGERYHLHRCFRIFDGLEKDYNVQEINISEKIRISTDGIDWLEETVRHCSLDEDYAGQEEQDAN